MKKIVGAISGLEGWEQRCGDFVVVSKEDKEDLEGYREKCAIDKIGGLVEVVRELGGLDKIQCELGELDELRDKLR